MDKKIITFSAISILLFASLAWALVENNTKDKIISSLNEKIQDLTDQNIQLQTWLKNNVTYYEEKVSSLNLQISMLQEEKNQLQIWLEDNITHYESEINSLSSQVSRLQAEKTQLQMWLEGNITHYEEQINLLNSQKAMLEERISELTIRYDDLYASHEKLIDEYYDYIMAYQSLVDRVNWRWSKSNIEAFITPEDTSVKSIVYSITGGWSDPSDWSEFWTDIKVMYDWVVNNIEYRYDGLYPILPYDPHDSLSFWNEMWQLPNETLELREGDCEDMAILLCSMIRSYVDCEYDVEVICIKGTMAGHAAVQIPVSGNLLTILDPAGRYYTHDFFGSIDQKDISTEINNWLNYWKPQLGSNVYVRRVFSDYMNKTFESTDEYIVWMYER